MCVDFSMSRDVDSLGNREYQEKGHRKADAINGGVLLGEQVDHCGDHKDHSGRGQTDWDFFIADADVARDFVFLVMALKAKRQHAKRLEGEAPDHAEGIRFAQQIDIPAAEDDSGHLQQRDEVDDAIRSPEFAVWLAEFFKE